MTESMLLNEINEREREVIALLADGLTNNQIAGQLFLADSTVKWYIRQLNSKLDTKNREEIIERAQELGLLDDNVPEPVQQKHNLRPQTTPFVGREAELTELDEILRRKEVRLLTIHAPGGMGKTRLALEAAEQQLDSFSDGVYFVPLDTITAVGQIFPAIAQAIDYHLQNDGRDVQQQVLNYLQHKTMLLVLDNWEHLLDDAEVINTILREAPSVKVLATSREKLNLSSESVYPLGGLRFTEWHSVEDALEDDAVQLLIQSAHRAKPDWELSPAQLTTIARICQLTDGMPLGILLATSWLDVLSLDDIADEIEKNTDFLETEKRDIPARQRSIRAVFDWSWQRLAPEEQTVLGSLAVFHGGFTREASQVIAQANVRQLQTFVNKSFLMRLKDDRYEMPHLLRQYAEQNLDQTGSVVHTRHAEYYLKQLASYEDALKSDKQDEALPILDSEFSNIRAAWRWAVTRKQYDLLNNALEPLRLYCVMRGRLDARNSLLADAWQLFDGDKNALDLHPFVARLLVRHSREDAAHCLKIAEKRGDADETAFCLYTMGYVAFGKRKYQEAIETLEQSLRIYQKLGDKFYEARVLGHLGVCYLMTGELNKAANMQQDSLHLLDEIGDKNGLAGAIYARGSTAFVTGNYTAAERLYREAYSIHQEMGNPAQIGWVGAGLSLLLFLNGDKQMAQDLAEQSIEIVSNTHEATDMLHRGSEALALCVIGLLATFNGEYKEARKMFDFADTYRRTANLQIEAIIAFGRTLFELAQDKPVEAVEHFIKLLQFSLKQQNTGAMALCLPLAAVLLSRQKSVDMGQIVMLLALLDAQPANARGWLEHWQQFQTLRAAAKQQLADADYQRAWQQGKALDLETIVGELLTEFGA